MLKFSPSISRLCLIILLAVPTARLTAQEAAAPSDKPHRELYGDWDTIPYGAYFLNNAVWGKGSITDFRQSIYRVHAGRPFPAGWKWRWPEINPDQVKSYPDISFGRNPWQESATTPLLPRRIDRLREITAVYSLSHQVSGKYNLAFDLWITRTPGRTNPPEANITREIMIWLDHQGDCLPREWFVKRVTVDGEEYDLYFAKNLETEKYRRDYLAFLKVIPEYSGVTRIRAFLDYLVANGYLLSTEFFRNVDLGNEIWYGAGETVIQEYTVTVTTR